LAGVRVKGKPRTLVLVDTTARDRVFAILSRLLISMLACTVIVGESGNGYHTNVNLIRRTRPQCISRLHNDLDLAHRCKWRRDLPVM
jgi:hypothetical protein